MMGSPETLELARCAEVACHLAHAPTGNHAEIVARLGLSWAQWEALAARWSAAREAELSHGGTALSSVFVRSFAAAADRLNTEPPMVGPPDHRPDGSTPTVEVRGAPGGVELDAPAFTVDVQTRALSAADLVAPGEAQPTPFAPSAAASGSAIDRAMAHADAVQGPRGPVAMLGSTAVAPPGMAPSGPGPGNLTIEQYTSLRVELALLPNHAATVLRRYGLGPDDKEAVFAYWGARFAADPPMRMSFARGYAEYIAWMKNNPAVLAAIEKQT